MTSRQLAWVFAFVGTAFAACTGGQTACGSPPTAPGGEIVLGEEPVPTPDPPVPTVRPCMKDDPTGCSASPDNEKRVVDGQHYSVEVLASDPRLGPDSAPVTLVVFSDFECPFCGRLEPTLAELRERYSDQLRIVWKDHPLSIHPLALPAALLAREAYAKGGNELFWKVHTDLFEHQSELSSNFLNSTAQHYDLPPRSHVQLPVDASLNQARSLGVRSTPTSFVNGRAVVGNQPLEAYTTIIDDELSMRAQAR